MAAFPIKTQIAERRLNRLKSLWYNAWLEFQKIRIAGGKKQMCGEFHGVKSGLYHKCASFTLIWPAECRDTLSTPPSMPSFTLPSTLPSMSSSSKRWSHSVKFPLRFGSIWTLEKLLWMTSTWSSDVLKLLWVDVSSIARCIFKSRVLSVTHLRWKAIIAAQNSQEALGSWWRHVISWHSRSCHLSQCCKYLRYCNDH